MEKKTLEKGEFAIKEGAKFIPIKGKGKVKVTKKGKVTLTFELENTKDNLLEGPKKDEEFPAGFVSFGVFKHPSDENFISGVMNEIFLTIPAGGLEQVKLTSINLDTDLLTDGIKGEHGGTK